MNFLWALTASVAVSVISFAGAVTLVLNEARLKKILIYLVALSAGGLIGGAFLHLLPEAFRHSQDIAYGFSCVVAGFTLFFVLEKYFYWRHCHKGRCEVHSFTYLNLFGDGIHNFIDGLIIGTSFTVDVRLGWVTTLAIILHEIPQELGDFGVLIYGGLSAARALFYNFLSATTAIAGTAIGYFFAHKVGSFTGILLPVAAGGFIYVASCDLIPELHRQPDARISMLSMLLFLAGLGLMMLVKLIHVH